MNDQQIEALVKWAFNQGWEERRRMTGVTKGALDKHYHDRIRIIIGNRHFDKVLNRIVADERTASQQAPDQGDAAGLQITSSSEECEAPEDITHYSKEYVERIEACSNARKAEILRLRETADELAEEVQRLHSWKAQALACTPDWQAIGRALNLKLGTSVSDQVLPAILKLLREKHELVIALRRLQCYCKGYVRAYETSTRYREVETLLDQHHHSTEVNP